MGAKLSEKESQEEIEKAFLLFAKDNKEYISVDNLREIAKELGENVSDEELMEMVAEANQTNPNGVVTKQQFRDILNPNSTFN
mmetsp:Transcript_21940/g.18821  ORF Transcript_21940/g.18821 Transcript_21940/m.18821 type:complete len:83 (+) Transcript_21940:326-574(+)